MLQSRKFVITLIAIGVILVIAVAAALLKRFAAIDIDYVAQWAMITVASAGGLGQATIAAEDVGKAKAAAGAKIPANAQ